ncbi:MAG: RDD family protein [Chloroflexota bacterium]
MNCQNCDAPVSATDDHCGKCGAKVLQPKVILGAPKVEDFTLTAEEPSGEFEDPAAADDWKFSPRGEFEVGGAVEPKAREAVTAPLWGGFFRRLFACCIDVAVILLLCAVMGVMAYIGYKVGLSAHDRSLTLHNAGPLVSLLTLAGMGLTTAYFVVFHGMDGRTIGKWLLGLRVVGADRQPIGYRQALLRWIGTVGLGAASFGLAFLWILWQPEKRGWHDFLARTWVIRE